MNKQKIMGIVRHILTFGGGFVVSQGWLDEQTMVQMVGAIITIVGGIWSVMAPEKSDM
jgi:flagellar motor component MotA